MYNFVSESVSDGHPDKIADQISDAIVDDIIQQDSNAKIAVETLIKDHNVIIAGEISGSFKSPNWDVIVKQVLLNIGHIDTRWGLDISKIKIDVLISEQSQDIAHGVNQGEVLGAGDQGMMYGYACNRTPEYLPVAIAYAHRLMRKHKAIRNHLDLGPDAKCQITLCRNSNGQKIDNIVFSSQHSPDIKHHMLNELIVENIIKPSIPHSALENTKYFINPAGPFILGGPIADCGVTGRKIIVDTYGSAVLHGGGAFSGKDPSKVDRSAAYMARYLSKLFVALHQKNSAQVTLAYAIGRTEPVFMELTSDNHDYTDFLSQFDLTPRGIINTLRLQQPIYFKTASFGHFGRDDLPWEQIGSGS